MKSPLKVPSLIITNGAIRAAQLQEFSAPRLLIQAERLYLARDTARLSQVADELAELHHPGAQGASDYYRSVLNFRAGDMAQAISLAERAAGNSYAPRYRARAIQGLGVLYQVGADNPEAIRLYQEAIGASRSAGDAVAFVRAGITLADLYGFEGNLQAALQYLKSIRPAIDVLSKLEPYYSHLFSNEAAYWLLKAGRLEEARRFAQFAIISPYSRAYPEWAETAQEIEQASESKAAHKSILRAVAMPARSTARKRTPRTLFLVLKLVLKAPRRRSQPRTAIFNRELPRSRPTLEQVSLKIKIRAPSF